MLLIETIVQKSPIHGNGVFTTEFIPLGMPIWRIGPKDIIIPIKEIKTIPANYLTYLFTYGTFNKKTKTYFMDGDNCRYMNHSTDPNVLFTESIGIAIKGIKPYSELTCDYSTITTKEHFESLIS